MSHQPPDDGPASSDDSSLRSRVRQLERQNAELTAELAQVRKRPAGASSRAEKELQRANQHLREREEFLSAVIDHLPIALFCKDAQNDYRFILWNEKSEDIFGLPRVDVIGRNDYDFFPRDQADFFARIDHGVIQSGQAVDVPEEPVDSEGHPTVFVRTRKVALAGAQGAARYLLGISEDITNQRRASLALEESQQRLQSILDNTSAVIYLKSLDGHYLLVNRHFEELFHLDRSTIHGRTDYDIFDSAAADAFRTNDLAVQKARRAIVFEEVAPHDDGPHTYVSVKFPMFDPEGILYGVCGISTDITDRKRAEETLRVAQETAESASRAKSRFLANMSHEIRTPIMAMLAAAELLPQARHENQEWVSRIDAIMRNGRHLLLLIDDLLDITRLEAGKLELHVMPTSLVEALTDVRAVVEPLVHDQPVQLEFRFQSDIPDLILADCLRLKQLVINLVGNALKFTPKGHVHVEVSFHGQFESSMLTIAVRDTGIGISAEASSTIYDAFTQIETSPTRTLSGAGLGLAIVKGILSQMGGTIQLESKPGEGSCFTICLPVEVMPEAVWLDARCANDLLRTSRLSQGEAPSVRVAGKILLAEDSDDARELMKWSLANAGADVVAVANGQDALQAAADHSFDLFLLDLRMPVLGGMETARELRRRGCMAPIIALSASKGPEEGDQILAAGFDEYWPKPLSMDRLIRNAAAFLPLGKDSGASAASSELSSKVQLRLQALRGEFIHTLPDRLARLRTSVEAQDLAQVDDVLHQLRGTCGTFDLMSLTDHAAKMRDLAAAGDIASLKTMLDQFDEMALRALQMFERP